MSNSPFYKTGISKSPLFHMGHGKDKITNHHGSYNDGDLISYLHIKLSNNSSKDEE